MTLRRYSSVATETTLATGITSASTSLTLANPSGYPVVGPFTIRVSDEAILVGTNTGGVLTDLTRGFDGTFAVAHSTGVIVNHVAVGDDFDNRWLDTRLDRPFLTYDDEFGSSSLDASWSQVTPTGTTVWTQGNGVLSVTTESQVTDDVCALMKSLPVLPPHTIETAVRVFAGRVNYTMIGLVFSDGISPTSNAVGIWLEINSGGMGIRQRSGTFTAMTSNDTYTTIEHQGPWLHMRFKWKGINLFGAEFSSDGVSWISLNFPDIFLVFTPTHAGMMITSWGGTALDSKVGTFEYFRTYQ